MSRQEQSRQEFLAEKSSRDLEELHKKANKKYFSDYKFYTVFRVGDKFKNLSTADTITIDGLAKFDRHSNRKGKVINADPSKKHLNKILIGSRNLEEDAMMYLEGVKINKNSVVAREIILSAGHGFWNKLSDKDRDKWVQSNYNFIQKYFGENCVYAVLHMDESTPHIHLLLIPVMTNKKGLLYLNNSYYFDGKEKMSQWQDRYTEAMTNDFQNIFKRGIKGSKATHVDLQTYYALIKEDLDELNSESILANAKENYINKKRIDELENVISNKDEIIKLSESIIEKNKEIHDNNKLYEHTIKVMSEKYNIPSVEVYKILDNKINQQASKDNSNQRER